MDSEELNEFRTAKINSGDILIEFKMHFDGEVFGKGVIISGVKGKNQHEISAEIIRAATVLGRVYSGVFHNREDLRNKFSYLEYDAEVSDDSND